MRIPAEEKETGKCKDKIVVEKEEEKRLEKKTRDLEFSSFNHGLFDPGRRRGTVCCVKSRDVTLFQTMQLFCIPLRGRQKYFASHKNQQNRHQTHAMSDFAICLASSFSRQKKNRNEVFIQCFLKLLKR